MTKLELIGVIKRAYFPENNQIPAHVMKNWVKEMMKHKKAHLVSLRNIAVRIIKSRELA